MKMADEKKMNIINLDFTISYLKEEMINQFSQIFNQSNCNF